MSISRPSVRLRHLIVSLVTLVASASFAVAPSTAFANHQQGSSGGSHDCQATAPSRIDLPNGFAPEGITSGRGSTVYVGSLADGSIWRGDVSTGTGAVLAAGATGRVTVGVDYDRYRNLVWAVGGPTGEVRAYSADTGALMATYTVAGSGFLNDLVVTRRAVYATDSYVQRLVVIPLSVTGPLPAPSAATTLPLTGDISFVAGAFNANGIVQLRPGVLVLVQTVTGLLFRVDARTGVTKRIPVAGATLMAGDGLELHGRTLYVVHGTDASPGIDVVRLRHDGRAADFVRKLTDASLDVPTTAALVRADLWVVNARFNTPVTPTTAYWISREPVRC
jgi:hypothetical protein